MKETELAEKVVSWLDAQHWEVYQEVDPKGCGGIADIVAVSGPILWVIECKVSLSLALLEQVIGWKGHAHFISIATPYPRRRVQGRRAAQRFLNQNGIGWLEIDRSVVTKPLSPRMDRRVTNTLQQSLNERQKTYAPAGNCEGLRWTPFQETCLCLLRVVKENPGIHLRAAMDQVRHHYASDATARACISKYVQMPGEIVKGVTCERDGRFLRLYPREQGI